ncbi:diguanylate cyclase [Methylomonas sp. SURF-2]|uniref:Diguanylate cyclase n=1 Tax=Methylomonas subterranea TaxID=2952225 RepID=A0ABT1TH91_9GAMM|nr:diguanylate cyclase [Methylomonas sp. SURF-2]MCQ8104834.1 diguanylate cyclase [Methylomonas sp. SURF-2]
MIAKDALKDKIIIVAEHNDASRRQIDAALKDHGYSDIRHAETGESIYRTLQLFYDQPEKIGLIVVNENLPRCQLGEMRRNLADADDEVAIPLLVIGDNNLEVSDSPGNPGRADDDSGLTHKLASPFHRQELLLTVNFLLKLAQQRLLHNAQKKQLLLELSARNVSDAQLKYLVAHDELTGFFNRGNFENRLKLALNRCHKLHRNAALLFIEVDRFCLINEWKGFDVGARLLVELAVLMRKLAPSKSLFARVGDNEFCLFLEDMDTAQARMFAENFKRTVENYRFVFDDANHQVTLSLGISTPRDVISCEHPGKLMLYARQACQFSKSCDRNKVGVYDLQSKGIKERQNDITWAPIVEQALRENLLFLVFQPVVELENGAISHYEVLLRMRYDGKTVLPNIFIPVAERMGLMHAVDLWVIENAIDFLAALPAHKAYISVAIKLSAGACKEVELIDIVRHKLELSWVNAARLMFEIAESAVIEHHDSTLHMVNKIRALGCHTAMRMSGAGFNGYEYLKTFPVDYVKIDGHFIKPPTGDENRQMMLKSMVDMVTQLGKKTIFVYVESSSTVMQLREIGVTLAQGYMLGKPESYLLEGTSIPFAQYMSEKRQVEKALSEKESYLRVLIDNIPFLVWLKDTESRFLAVNQLLARQMRWGCAETVEGKTDFDFYPREKALRYQLEDQQVLASRQRKTMEEEVVDASGTRRWSEIFLAPVIDKNGEPLGTLGFARDITERKRVETDLRIAATAFESQEGMVVTDADAIIMKINHAFTRITGFTADEAIGRKMNILKSGMHDADFYGAMWESINSTGSWQGEIWNRRKDGEICPVWQSITAVKADDGDVTHYVGTMIDITARKAIEEQMHHIAYHDVLTNLPNRILLADRLQQALARAKRENTKLALMYIDLDKFKPVNDNFGHDVGDLLLKDVAARLSTCVKRESDTVARLGGDEFVVLLSNYEQETDLSKVAKNMLNTLSEPFRIEEHRINISSSIGIATYPADGIEAGCLMKSADHAMYQAKHAGRSCFKFHAGEKPTRLSEK